jgi:RNA polymerase sigma-70 factor (ECF subfamily)
VDIERWKVCAMGYVSEKHTAIKADLESLLPRLLKFASALTGTSEASTELLRATCRAVLTRAAKEKGQTPLALWAFAQMHTLWVARLAEHPRVRREDIETELFQGGANGVQAGVSKFVSHLPPHQRATLMLVYGFGYSYDEAADIFGVPVSTIMTRLVRSHAGLNRWLEHRGIPDSNAYTGHGARVFDDYEEQAA